MTTFITAAVTFFAAELRRTPKPMLS